MGDSDKHRKGMCSNDLMRKAIIENFSRCHREPRNDVCCDKKEKCMDRKMSCYYKDFKPSKHCRSSRCGKKYKCAMKGFSMPSTDCSFLRPLESSIDTFGSNGNCGKSDMCMDSSKDCCDFDSSSSKSLNRSNCNITSYRPNCSISTMCRKPCSMKLNSCSDISMPDCSASTCTSACSSTTTLSCDKSTNSCCSSASSSSTLKLNSSCMFSCKPMCRDPCLDDCDEDTRRCSAKSAMSLCKQFQMPMFDVCKMDKPMDCCEPRVKFGKRPSLFDDCCDLMNKIGDVRCNPCEVQNFFPFCNTLKKKKCTSRNSMKDFCQKDFCQQDPCEKDFCEKDFCQQDPCEKDFCEKDFCQKDFCQKDFCQKDFCQKDFCQKDFCQKDFCQKDFCQEDDICRPRNDCADILKMIGPASCGDTKKPDPCCPRKPPMNLCIQPMSWNNCSPQRIRSAFNCDDMMTCSSSNTSCGSCASSTCSSSTTSHCSSSSTCTATGSSCSLFDCRKAFGAPKMDDCNLGCSLGMNMKCPQRDRFSVANFCDNPVMCDNDDDDDDDDCGFGVCPGADEWFPVTPDLQRAVARLAMKSLKAGDSIEQDLSRLKDANILPPDFYIPCECKEEGSVAGDSSWKSESKESGKDLESSPSQLKIAAEKLVEHILCRAAKLESADEDEKPDLSECDMYLDDLVKKLGVMIQKLSMSGAESSESATSASESEATTTTNSSSVGSINASSNNSALAWRKNTQRIIKEGLLSLKWLTLLDRKKMTLNEAKQLIEDCKAVCEDQTSGMNENNSQGDEMADIVIAKMNANKATKGGADSDSKPLSPQSKSSQDEDSEPTEGEISEQSTTNMPPTTLLEVNDDEEEDEDEEDDDDEEEEEEEEDAEATKVEADEAAAELRPSRQGSIDQDVLRELENCLQDCSKLAEDPSLKSFVTDVVYSLYSTVRGKLEKMLEKQAAGVPPEKLAMPLDQLLDKADHEIRDSVLPTVIEHIVWLVRQDAKNSVNPGNEEEIARALAGEYVDTIVTNAVLKIDVHGVATRPHGKIFVASSNDGDIRKGKKSPDAKQAEVRK